MPSLPTSFDIFRFIAIRNPDQVLQTSPHLIYAPESVLNGDVAKSLTKAWTENKPDETAREVISQFTSSENCLLNIADGGLATFLLASKSRIHAEALDRPGTNLSECWMSLVRDVPSHLKSYLTEDSAVRKTYESAWLSYLVFQLIPQQSPQLTTDLGECIRLLNAFVVARSSASTDAAQRRLISPDVLRTLLAADLVVSKPFLQSPKLMSDTFATKLKRIGKERDTTNEVISQNLAKLTAITDALEFLEKAARTGDVFLKRENTPSTQSDDGPGTSGTGGFAVHFRPHIWEGLVANPSTNDLIHDLSRMMFGKDDLLADRLLGVLTQKAIEYHRRLPIDSPTARLLRLGRSTTPLDAVGLTDVFEPLTGQPLVNDNILAPENTVAPPLGQGRTRILGMGDLKVVRQQLLKYALGDIAHIENVLAGERRSRTHKRTDRTEQVTVEETESTTQTERDLQSTEHFGLNEEASKTIQSDAKFQAGVTVTANYGPLAVSANAGYTSSTAQTESQKQARQYAKDVVNRSTEKIIEKTTLKRTSTTFNEVIEENFHAMKGGNSNRIGVYRWVDKWYLARVYNYGIRLMLEFVVPEPAAFLKHALGQAQQVTNGLVAPTPPTFLGRPLKPTDLTRSNYLIWVSRYEGMGSIDPPPALFKAVSAAYGEKQPVFGKYTDLDLTADYILNGVGETASYLGPAGISTVVSIADTSFVVPGTFPGQPSPVSGKIPVSFIGSDNETIFAINVVAFGILSDEAFEKWQITVFQTIMSAYGKAKADYESALAEAGIQQGIQIKGRSPDANREIEKNELKRGCLELLLQDRFDTFGSTFDLVPPLGYPEFSFVTAFREGAFAEFFEQLFEWEQITYVHFPYAWARKAKWVEMLNQEDADPLFAQFLTAGSTRVVVPVRPGYEKALMYYLRTGVIWENGDPPVINDPLYVSIVQSIREQEGVGDEGRPEGQPWQVKMPTTLVILEDRPTLPDFTEALGSHETRYFPSDETCNGLHYNAAQWPDDGFAIHKEYGLLGYIMPHSGDPIRDMSSLQGKLIIQAFQTRMNEIDSSLRLAVTGTNNACTLLALTSAHDMRCARSWPGPAGPIA